MTKAASRRNNQFVVSFGDVQLPDALAHRIELAMRKSVLTILAEADFHAKDEIGALRHPEWLGIWIRVEKPAVLDDIPGIELGGEFAHP